MIALIFLLAALLFVFAIAGTSALVLVARNARDAERASYEDELEDLGAELEQERHARVNDHRYIHEIELLLAGAGVPCPPRSVISG